jgi:NADH-quinone oxidoreductase subunit C
VTDSPSDRPEAADGETARETALETAPDAGSASASAAAEIAGRVAEQVGATSWSADYDTAKVYVERERWVEAVAAARDGGLPFFSWLTAIDWSRQVEVGEQAAAPDDLEERYEVICRLSSVTDASSVHLVTSLPKDDPTIASLVPTFGGAEWHEREAAEMFGIAFEGHPHLVKLYLPDGFEGNPLRKSFALLAREVKPWPGTVDVEGMPGDAGPSTENVEAAALEGGEA